MDREQHHAEHITSLAVTEIVESFFGGAPADVKCEIVQRLRQPILTAVVTFAALQNCRTRRRGVEQLRPSEN